MKNLTNTEIKEIEKVLLKNNDNILDVNPTLDLSKYSNNSLKRQIIKCYPNIDLENPQTQALKIISQLFFKLK